MGVFSRGTEDRGKKSHMGKSESINLWGGGPVDD